LIAIVAEVLLMLKFHNLVYGQNGLSLKKYWNENGFPKTNKTITVNQFPNFFVLLGPGSGLGHNSVVIMAEW
jgi:cation diffusion facilitator CzcD-associated flavoprotein CzcO